MKISFMVASGRVPFPQKMDRKKKGFILKYSHNI